MANQAGSVSAPLLHAVAVGDVKALDGLLSSATVNMKDQVCASTC